MGVGDRGAARQAVPGGVRGGGSGARSGPLRSRSTSPARTSTTPTLAGLPPLVDAAISPITDVRATKEYRTHMSRVMLERSLVAAAARLEGGGPAYGESVI